MAGTVHHLRCLLKIHADNIAYTKIKNVIHKLSASIRLYTIMFSTAKIPAPIERFRRFRFISHFKKSIKINHTSSMPKVFAKVHSNINNVLVITNSPSYRKTICFGKPLPFSHLPEGNSPDLR